MIALLAVRLAFAGILLCCCCACDRQVERVCPSSAFAEGDVAFRRGCGGKSAVVLRVDSSGIYSHCGIVVRQDSTFMIVHVAPGERNVGESEETNQYIQVNGQWKLKTGK